MLAKDGTACIHQGRVVIAIRISSVYSIFTVKPWRKSIGNIKDIIGFCTVLVLLCMCILQCIWFYYICTGTGILCLKTKAISEEEEKVAKIDRRHIKTDSPSHA